MEFSQAGLIKFGTLFFFFFFTAFNLFFYYEKLNKNKT